MKGTVHFSENNPQWVDADLFEIDDSRKTATAEAWGERFEGVELDYEPADLGSPKLYFVKVMHSSGNWLKIFQP